MPVVRYCWRCRADMPMLTEPEWSRVMSLLDQGNLNREFETYREQHSCSDAEAREKGVGASARMVHEEITGGAAEFQSVFHHRLSSLGSDCPKCTKPLRSPQANFCAVCDWRRVAST
jgi:hypothetical protein